MAWGLWPRDYGVPLTPGRGEWAFGAWLKLGRDGVLTVAVPQLEMGQGITTLIPQIVAAEMVGAAELDPPLVVDVGIGPNWLAAK